MTMGAVAVRHDPTSAALVRHTIADDLMGEGVNHDCIDDVVLVASELVGNAVVHATTEAASPACLDVGWEVTSTSVILSVGDDSSVMPMPRLANSEHNSGRGLAIVAAIAQDWGVERTASGKRVWAQIPITRRA